MAGKSHLTSVPTSDPKNLPDLLKEQLSQNYIAGTMGSKLLSRLNILLDDSEEKQLSIDEIIVAYFYKHDSEVLKRANLTTRLATFVKEGKIEKVEKGVFKRATTASSLPES